MRERGGSGAAEADTPTMSGVRPGVSYVPTYMAFIMGAIASPPHSEPLVAEHLLRHMY